MWLKNMKERRRIASMMRRVATAAQLWKSRLDSAADRLEVERVEHILEHIRRLHRLQLKCQAKLQRL